MRAWKALAATSLAALSVYLQKMAVAVVLLAVVMVLDYATGVGNAWKKGEVSSSVGMQGIVKKVAYLALVAVGMSVDYLLSTGMATVGLAGGTDFLFAQIIIIWLILNELISITENVAGLGVPVPPFLLKVLQKARDRAEDESGLLTDAPEGADKEKRKEDET